MMLSISASQQTVIILTDTQAYIQTHVRIIFLNAITATSETWNLFHIFSQEDDLTNSSINRTSTSAIHT